MLFPGERIGIALIIKTPPGNKRWRHFLVTYFLSSDIGSMLAYARYYYSTDTTDGFAAGKTQKINWLTKTDLFIYRAYHADAVF
jgi:hypothetical protein